jgi:hypothetical protein
VNAESTGAYALPPTPLEECLSAVLRGVVGTTPATYTGVTKDEALDYAGVLAERVRAVVAFIEDVGCTCPKGLNYASLPDHELSCFAQVQHLLRTDARGENGECR